MKFRGTTWLGIFAVGLAGYTAWEYRKAQDSIGIGVGEQKLFTLAPADVEKVKITRPDGVMTIEKQDGEWQIREPLQDMAGTIFMDGLIYSLVIQKGRTFQTEDSQKTSNLADYGLDKPGAVVEVTGKGKTETLTVSHKNAFDGSYYVSQGEALYLGDPGLAQVVGKDVKSLRSRQPWRAGDVEITSVEVALPAIKEKYTLKMQDKKWVVDPAPKFRIDEERIKEWIDNLQSVSASEVVMDHPSADDKQTLSLVKPSFMAVVKYKKPDGIAADWTFTAGQDKGEMVFAMSTERDTVYKYNRKSLNNMRVQREYFRDGRAAFQFPLEKVTEIEIRQDGFRHKFKKDGSQWQLAEDGKDLVLDQDKLVKMVQALTRIEAQEFFPVKDAKGFKEGEGIFLRDSQGGEVFRLTWGDEYKGKQSFNEAMTFRAIRTNLESEAMGVDAAKFKTLIDPTLVTKREQK